jgi:hypothetical protein
MTCAGAQFACKIKKVGTAKRLAFRFSILCNNQHIELNNKLMKIIILKIVDPLLKLFNVLL